jgi:hypothetical protein
VRALSWLKPSWDFIEEDLFFFFFAREVQAELDRGALWLPTLRSTAFASAWGGVLRQNGQTVTDFPYAGSPATATTAAVAGRSSSRNDYVLAATELTHAGFSARYNVFPSSEQPLR